MQNAIVLNRMYVGNYLMSNLGHEIINLYQADNGNHYLYLNSTGDFVQTHHNKVGYMLMVKYHCVGEVEVIALATELEDVYSADQKFNAKNNDINADILARQKEYASTEGGISYGGVSVFDIFRDFQQQSVFVTYKARKILIPKTGKRIFMRFRNPAQSQFPQHDESALIVTLEGYQQAKASLKQYIYPDGTYKGDLAKDHIEEKKRDYTKIFETLIADSAIWEEYSVPVSKEGLNEMSQRNVSLFDICQVQNDENKFSNALAYFMTRPEYFTLWKGFFINYGIELAEKFTVSREEASKIEDTGVDPKEYPSGGRIDLLLRTNNSIIVIENKIKSDINSIEEDGEGKQLVRYYNYSKWRTSLHGCTDYGKTPYFIILTPNYNPPVIDDDQMKSVYKVITYGDLYGYLSVHKEMFEHDNNFLAFFEAMHRHTHENVNDYLYFEMQDKFFRIIKEVSENLEKSR